MGSIISGFVIDAFFTDPRRELKWKGIWLSFAAYSLVIGLVFMFVFKEKARGTAGVFE